MSHFTTFIAVPSGEADYSLEGYIGSQLDPFCEGTEDPDYLEFHDKTEEIARGYNSDTLDCVKMPGGKIVSLYNHHASGFAIKDGMVFQESAGPLKHNKRTKKAKKMLALTEYPMNKLYPTIERYAEDYCGYYYDEDHKAYGYHTNPNAFWDWYQIGGRWPFMFLVKTTCPDAIRGGYSWATEGDSREAPEGYKWVAGARKSDIAWDAMKTLRIEASIPRFKLLEEAFKTGILPDEPLLTITEDGIASWGEMIYKKDETLENYLERNELGPDCKYPVSAYSFLSDGEYCSRGDMGWWGISKNDKPEMAWQEETQTFIDEIDDDDFIVTIDCHI